MKNAFLFLSTWMMLIVGSMLFFLLYDFNTKQVIVAVLDSGVNTHHELLKDRVMQGYDFVDRDHSPEDGNGHGTHVAGIVAQQTSKTKIMPIRMIGKEGKLGINSFLPILYAITHGADIINMSYSEESNLAVRLIVWLGEKKGVMFVAATGNDGKKQISYPAAYKGVYAIAASDEENNGLYENSNINSNVTFVTPGVEIKSAGRGNHQYTRKTGTSMASAYMAGTLAYFKEKNPDDSNDEIIKKVRKTSNQWGSYEIVDLKKEQTLQENKAYLWLQKPDMFTTKDRTTFVVHTSNASETQVVQNDKPLLEKSGDVNRSFHIPIEEGENEFRVIVKKGTVTQSKYFSVIRDETKPQIKTSLVNERGSYFLKIKINEPYLKELYVNGNAKEITFDSFNLPSHEELTLKVDSYDFPMMIEATDYSGNKEESSLTSDIFP